MKGLKILVVFTIVITSVTLARVGHHSPEFPSSLFSTKNQEINSLLDAHNARSLSSNNENLQLDKTFTRIFHNKGITSHRRALGSFISLFKLLLPKIAKYAYRAGLVMIKLGNTGLKIGSFVKTIGDLLTDGCLSHPQICTYMDAIKEIEPRTTEKVTQLEEIYAQHKESYHLLQDSAVNNVYIELEVGKIVEMVNAIGSKGKNIKDNQDLFINLTKLYEMPDEEILKLLKIPLKYSVKQLERFHNNSDAFNDNDLFSKVSYKIGSYVALAAFAKYNPNSTDLGCLGCSAFKNKNYSSIFNNEVFNVIKITEIKIQTYFFEKYFVGQMKVLVQESLQLLSEKISKPDSFVSRYVKSLKLTRAIGTLASTAVSIVMLINEDRKWAEVEKSLKGKYESFVELERKLDQAVADADSSSTQFDPFIYNVNNDYVSFVTKFDEKVGSILKNNVPKSILTPEGNVTKENILSYQVETRIQLEKIKITLEKITIWMRSYDLVVNHVMNTVLAGESLNMALEEIRSNWQYFGQDIQEFSYFSTPKYYVCIVSTLLITEDFYSNYELKSIREECASSAEFEFSEEYKTKHQRHTIDFYILSFINTARYYFRMYDDVAEELRKDPLIGSDAGFKIQNMFCRIAVLFPKKDTWMDFSLDDFRIQDCDSMTDETFWELEEKSWES